jgi:hypothetical protein
MVFVMQENKMNKMNKIKKQKNNGRILLLILGLLICLPTVFGANMYETIQSLESRGCNLVNEKEVSSLQLDDLIARFGLQLEGSNNCSFVIDTVPYGSLAHDLVFFPAEDFELDYVVDGTEEYLFLLGSEDNEDFLDPLFNLVYNYDLREPFLAQFGPLVFISESMNFDIPVPTPNNCVGEEGNPYAGNNISYDHPLGGSIFSESTCIEDFLSFPYCEGQRSFFKTYDCNCDNGMCIATFNDVFILASSWETPAPTFPPQPMDPSLVETFELTDSAINSWMSG